MAEETKQQAARGAATTEEAELPLRTIKRYANRKLYDTTDSRYVTLHQIAEFVRQGEDIRIIDNKTKEDLTNVTLAQIIYEEQKNADETQASSVRSLRSFIQQSRERLMHSLRDGPMGKLVSRREDEEGVEGVEGERDVEGVEEQALLDDAGLPDEGEAPRRSAKETFDGLGRIADDRVKSVVAAAMSHMQQLQSEVKRLQSRIEELEERLKGRGKRDERDEAAGSEEAGDDPADRG